jgi:hypothetical protein
MADNDGLFPKPRLVMTIWRQHGAEIVLEVQLIFSTDIADWTTWHTLQRAENSFGTGKRNGLFGVSVTGHSRLALMEPLCRNWSDCGMTSRTCESLVRIACEFTFRLPNGCSMKPSLTI